MAHATPAWLVCNEATTTNKLKSLFGVQRTRKHVRRNIRKATHMSSKRWAFGEILAVFGDAISVAAAVRQGRQPAAHRLRALGIDPEQFSRIGEPYHG